MMSLQVDYIQATSSNQFSNLRIKQNSNEQQPASVKENITDWFYQRIWKTKINVDIRLRNCWRKKFDNF